MYQQTAIQFTKMLENLSRWMDKAKEHAKKKEFEIDTLTTARLAPDQYPFTKQIQLACDAAKFCCARLTGKQAPKHEDNETTFEQLQHRIEKCTTYLKTFTAEDFKDCERRPITLPFFEGKKFTGLEYGNAFGTANFYFHIVTAYSILRHNGVDLGKTDYIGGLTADNH